MIINFLSLFFKELVMLFLEMAPYLTLGLLIAGVLHVFLNKDLVARHVGGNSISSIIKAAIFGVPLPLCSCGVVPTAIYFKNSGASKPAVMSFLISTPQTGVDSIAATYGMLGPLFALFRAIAALILGIAGGLIEFFYCKKETSENFADLKLITGQDKLQNQQILSQNNYIGFAAKIKEIFRYAFFELLDDISINFIIGLVIAALISIMIPDNFFNTTFLSNSLVSMIFMVIIGIPMYVCSTSSIPIAVALILKGISPGAAYVFLVAGPATNAASLAIIIKSMGKNMAIRYVASIIIGSLIFGFLMDIIFINLDISLIANAAHHIGTKSGLNIFTTGVSIVLLIILIMLLLKKTNAKIRSRILNTKTDSDNNKVGGIMTKINIKGMNCGHCVANVKKALSQVKGINKIEVDLSGKCAYVKGDFSILEAAKRLNSAGYEVM